MSEEVSVEEIIKKYPRLAKYRSNEVGLRALYAQLEGLIKPIKEWKEGDQIDDAQVIVFKILRTNSYIGCSTCRTRAPDGITEHTQYKCAKCNETRTATTMKWYYLLLGDENDLAEGVITPARANGNAENLVGKIIKVSGVVREDKKQQTQPYGKLPSLTIRKFDIVEDVTDTTSAAIDTFETTLREEEEDNELPDKYLQLLRTFFSIMGNKVKVDRFNKFIASKKINKDLIIDYIKIDGDYVSFIPLLEEKENENENGNDSESEGENDSDSDNDNDKATV